MDLKKGSYPFDPLRLLYNNDMRIGIDARIYPTGIWRYNLNLVREIAAAAQPDDEVVVFLRKDNFNEIDLPDARFTKILADYGIYSFSEQFVFPLVLHKQNLDLVHFTNFNAPIFWPKRFVITIHDLIHQSHSTFGSTTRNRFYYLFKKSIYYLVIRLLAWRAANVIVPSFATKADVEEHLHVPASKITVTYEGLDQKLISEEKHGQNDQAVLSSYKIKTPYLLYVGTMYPHKNHRKLIEAFIEVRRERPDLSLVLVAKDDHFSQTLRAELAQKGLTDVIIQPNFEREDRYVPDSDLSVLYRNAELYVFPTLIEGFGIPLLEAQAYSVPVVASRIPCLTEVGGESAEYFDPENVTEMKDVILRLLADKNRQQELVEKGKDNLTRFSWKKMAEETYDVYKKVVG